MSRLVVSLSAADRVRVASKFLESFPGREVLLVSSTRTAGDELLRNICIRTGSVFGVHRFTVQQLAIETASRKLTEAERTILAGVAVDALAARAVHRCRKDGQLRWFESVAHTTGFFRALASTISELRLNGVDIERLEKSGAAGKDLANLLTQYAANLDESKLADLSTIFSVAAAATHDGEFALSQNPVLFLDIAPTSYLEQEFLSAIADHATDVMATAHAQDDATVRTFSRILKVQPTVIEAQETQIALDRLRRHVFQAEAPPSGSMDESVGFISAIDESRECIEIARSILTAAQAGVPFDKMTVLLRNPDLYQPLLEDALRRAGIPAFYTRGSNRPNPAGRALLALLACATEKLSATRFSEYLSLGQLPDIPKAEESARDSAWVPAQGELFAALPPPDEQVKADDTSQDSESAVIAGTLRTPRQWERLLVDAAVIGGHDRWVRRLEGLRKELQKRIEEIGAEDDPARQRIEQEASRLQNLQDFALPIIAALDRLPLSANWGDWLDDLEQLATMSLRHPEGVLSVLAELRPMAGIGPVTLDEVREALSDRLSFLRADSTERRYGKVFVATISEVSGLPFEIVFLPGLGEDIFPRKSFEDPLLLDECRAAVSPNLATRETRFSRERLLLHTAAATAVSRLWISYPRMDLGQGRARGPSFYALDVLRAITGRIPELRELQRTAAEASQSQIGWPAPRDANRAIDDSEFDLAVISQALRDPGTAHGCGRYLLEVSPTLARSLRARWSRWERRWSASDGLMVNADDASSRAALDKHRFSNRSYSATALQHFAACPYRFLLNSVFRLHPREERIALERLDPLTRGSLFHTMQFQLFSRLKSLNMLPITEVNRLSVYAIADEVLWKVAEAYREEVAPAIPKIWEAELEELRWDARGWIRQVASSPGASDWKPAWFELAFGLPASSERDPESSPDPVRLPGGPAVRGAIDLIEENAGRIRITDHKTGREPYKPMEFIGAGEVLQPLLYAAAAEALLGKKADSTRLSYCTERGHYRVIEIAVDDDSRAALAKAFNTIDQSLASGFLPAAPRERACQYCDYRMVCGPYEEFRVRRKPKGELSSLAELREIS